MESHLLNEIEIFLETPRENRCPSRALRLSASLKARISIFQDLVEGNLNFLIKCLGQSEK